ncbi:unnamed protein product [Sphagnum troendelagicum]|uniref:Uncharacterized protein n=1 Tax=Sphagnum troendelagicum TaxID=128251 RepID=A0ABP0TAW6_9BRYO
MRGSPINAADLVGRSPALVCSYTLGWKDLINAADQLVGSSSCAINSCGQSMFLAATLGWSTILQLQFIQGTVLDSS